ncbi:DUF4174 domain-containing protein [Pseudomonas syringae pv. tagetis]|uniref:DUF4174 domain-containing protein n=3 Tax=Pseudomonas syringae group TaxID=136849 RepID=A0A0N8QT04_9PSED|nr:MULTISPECIES: DUF4174 domain-containing protein [Pseudomonas syringae group]KAA8698052.1 DUF4174 domain-containing protein [Pseudomonas caricapapayae]KPW60238.1 Uncharacterized protein ALO80_01547 [Pseudomonas caricapapayae]KPX48463.1 Uncharacterized protein ALO68_02220 [Pseudomonas syringae pv. helianthi]KPY82398.1 Uncharacterized protein ALO44_02698 [Pseudomonas syringae pv. tagetis]RMM09746.1 hypothetical protein ALQ84_03793 [Pseudomonas caricapapayae]
MLIRSLTLATLLVAAGTALAADSDNPLAQERGKSRPLIVIAPSPVDPALVSLKKALDEPANREAFAQRNMVLFTVVNTIGERNGKSMDPQSTMALIRELKLGAGVGTKVILVGKDGEKKIDKTIGKSESIDPKEIFATIDQMPMREKEASAPPPEPEAKPAPAEKPGKPVKGGAPGKTLDD